MLSSLFRAGGPAALGALLAACAAPTGAAPTGRLRPGPPPTRHLRGGGADRGVGAAARGEAGAELADLVALGAACEAGAATACHQLGVAYVDGQGAARDPARAALLFDRACAGGVALGCRSLAIMHADGRGVPKDEGRAARLFRRACDAGDAVGCSNLGAMHAIGRGVPRDERRALELLERGCTGGDAWACERLE